MPYGSSHQHHLRCHAGSSGSLYLRLSHRHHPHGLDGHTAALSGLLYRASKGKIAFACLGEVIGTGIIGAIVSYPVMALLWGRSGLTWMFYVPSFIAGTLIGGSIAFILLTVLQKNGALKNIQQKLGVNIHGRLK